MYQLKIGGAKGLITKNDELSSFINLRKKYLNYILSTLTLKTDNFGEWVNLTANLCHEDAAVALNLKFIEY